MSTTTFETASASSSKEAEKNPYVHLGYLDGLRAVAALFVLFSHILCTVAPTGLLAPLTSWLFYGKFAVNLFLVLSGFCLMLPVVLGSGTLAGGARKFYLKRARRIIPPYYCAIALSILLAMTLLRQKTGTIWDYSLPVTAKDVVYHLLMLHDLYGVGKINYPLWTVAVEWQIYFLFPLLVLAWQKSNGAKVTALAVVGGYLAAFTVYHVHILSWLQGMTFQYVGLFALGMFAAAVSYSRSEALVSLRQRLPWGSLTLCGAAVIILCCNVLGRSGVGQHQPLVDILAGISAVCLLIYSSAKHPRNIVRHLLDRKLLVTIGTFAYSVYLVHAPLIQLVWLYGVRPLHLSTSAGFIVLAVVGAPLVIGCAYLFFVGFEKPFLTKHKRSNKTLPVNEAAITPTI